MGNLWITYLVFAENSWAPQMGHLHKQNFFLIKKPCLRFIVRKFWGRSFFYIL